MSKHDLYIRRCFELARLGAGDVSPNPMVGALLLYNDRIIGEGYHKQYGGPHAEVNAVASVPAEDRDKISDSTLYISLEPCNHQGKTPACTDLILSRGIKRVVISATDPNPKVQGAGLDRLREHGVEITEGILAEEGNELISNFKSDMALNRPFVILKFVQSSDRYIGKPDKQVWLSNDYEKVLVHKIRSEVDAIMVGTNTAVIDNPRLSNRYYAGAHPTRVILDRTLRIPTTHNIFDGSIPTIIYSAVEAGSGFNNVEVVKMTFDDGLIDSILSDLNNRKVQSVLVEGGAQLLRSFVVADAWDQAWVVTTPHVLLDGVKAPNIHGKRRLKTAIDHDVLEIIDNFSKSD